MGSKGERQPEGPRSETYFLSRPRCEIQIVCLHLASYRLIPPSEPPPSGPLCLTVPYRTVPHARSSLVIPETAV